MFLNKVLILSLLYSKFKYIKLSRIISQQNLNRPYYNTGVSNLILSIYLSFEMIMFYNNDSRSKQKRRLAIEITSH
jgi:hypothetical protein